MHLVENGTELCNLFSTKIVFFFFLRSFTQFPIREKKMHSLQMYYMGITYLVYGQTSAIPIMHAKILQFYRFTDFIYIYLTNTAISLHPRPTILIIKAKKKSNAHFSLQKIMKDILLHEHWSGGVQMFSSVQAITIKSTTRSLHSYQWSYVFKVFPFYDMCY